MFETIFNHVHNWVTEAPWMALIIVVGMLVVFWWVLQANDVPGWSKRKAKWLGITVQAIALPLLLFMVLWGMRVILARTEVDFRQQHGRVSDTNRESVEKIWGRPHVQRDLLVSHSYQQPVTEEVRDNLGRIVKRTHMEQREVPQNSIVRTRGEFVLTRSERQKGTAKYPGFVLQCHLAYSVKNFATRKTDAEFTFPLSPGQSKFDNFKVLVNGEDQSSRLSLDAANANWTLPMAPGQVDEVDITYTSQGLQRFYYQVADVREIRDFHLDLRLPDIPQKAVNYPEGCIPPTTIEPVENGHGSLLAWKLDRALTTRGMGIALPDPSQPGKDVSRMLRNAWHGGMLLLVLLAITAVAFGLGFSVLRTVLLGSIYAGEFMLLAAISDFFPNAWLPWLLAALGAIALSIIVLGGRRAPRPMLVLPVLFMGLYPLLALPEDVSASLFLSVDVLAIIYLAVLGIIALRHKPLKEEPIQTE